MLMALSFLVGIVSFGLFMIYCVLVDIRDAIENREPT